MSEDISKPAWARMEPLRPVEPPKKQRIVRRQLRLSSSSTNPIMGVVGGNAKILHCQEDRQGLGRIDIWIQEDDDGVINASLPLLILGTGQGVPAGYIHVNTVVMKNTDVWHIYKAV